MNIAVLSRLSSIPTGLGSLVLTRIMLHPGRLDSLDLSLLHWKMRDLTHSGRTLRMSRDIDPSTSLGDLQRYWLESATWEMSRH